MNESTLFCILLLSAQNVSAGETSADLIVDVTGVTGNGRVVTNLFRNGGDVMKIGQAYRQDSATSHEGRAHIVFRNLEYGRYAVSAFQDENGNGTLDHNLLRFPAEPLGFSNSFRLGMYSGLPTFEKLEFSFEPGREKTEIILH